MKNKKKIKNSKLNKRSQISIQTIFYILMLIFFIWILSYGYLQYSKLHKNISTEEKISLKKKIKRSIEQCEEPLHKDNIETIKIINPENYNGICLLGKNDPKNYYEKFPELKTLYETRNNLALINGKQIVKNNHKIFKELIIIDSEKIDTKIKSTNCYSINEKGIITLKIDCQNIETE